MDFHYYPNDEQVCDIKLESFGYTSEYIKLNWHEEHCCYVSPVLSMKQFKMKAEFVSSYVTNTYDLEYPGE